MGLPATADLGPVTLRYPSSSPALPMRRGPFLFNLAHNGLPARGNGRLVVVSHGTGGSPAVHAALARALVRAADVMALPEHVGDTDRDYSTKGNSESPNRRPLEVSRTSPFGPSPLRSRLDATASARLGMLPRMGRAPRGPVSVLWCPSRSATAAGP